MRVLVTGANGFVGRALVPALTSRGHQVRATTRYGSTTPQMPLSVELQYHGDLKDDIEWAHLVAGCDAVVHLASIAHVGPGVPADLYDRVNHRATVSLAQAAQDAGVSRFVFVSSIRAQSGPTSDHTLTETDEPRPTEPYGISKLAAENALRAMTLPGVILRPTLVYGPGVKGNFAALLRYARSRLPLPFGALKKQRSLLNIDGLVQAIAFALQNPKAVGQTYIVADPSPASVAQMIEALRFGLGRQHGLLYVPRGLLRAALTIIGKRAALDRLDGQLIASPAKLIKAGWKPPADTATSLTALAKLLS